MVLTNYFKTIYPASVDIIKTFFMQHLQQFHVPTLRSKIISKTAQTEKNKATKSMMAPAAGFLPTIPRPLIQPLKQNKDRLKNRFIWIKLKSSVKCKTKLIRFLSIRHVQEIKKCFGKSYNQSVIKNQRY